MSASPRGLARHALAALALLAAPAGASLAQADVRERADSLVRVGDLAARDSRPPEAIGAYESAIGLDPARRMPLLPKLARQYLWSDDSRKAAHLFAEYLRAHPDACETRLDLALALSWSNALDDARAAYDDVASRCPESRAQARLGAARTLRWGNHPAPAEWRYREVLAEGSAAQREQAAIGLAFVRLANAEPRAALALIDSLTAAGVKDPALVEAHAMALADLGATDAALGVARAAIADGRGSASLERLARDYEERAGAAVALGVRGFRDRDGTSYDAIELASGAAPVSFGAVRLAARDAELRANGVTARSREIDGSLDVRPVPALALSAHGGVRGYDALGFTPWDAELDAVWLPGDHHRVDISAARVLVTDNMAAIRERLTGDFASVGLTERLGTHVTTALSVDETRWSEGNTRLRLRATPQLRLDGLPLVTLEWPTVYQRYDEPFAFAFFSPPSYVETGPAVSVYRRVARAWYLSGYVRGGALRESGRAWQPLGVARGSLEREVSAHWGLRVDGAWTNSNLAGSTGFQRSSFGVEVTIRP